MIDIRWSGGWLTSDGKYYSVDYKNGVTHETIANQHGELIGGSGSIMTRPPIMRIFDIALWMRIAVIEYSTFCVELLPYWRFSVSVVSCPNGRTGTRRLYLDFSASQAWL
jgi:hypothetical protein